MESHKAMETTFEDLVPTITDSGIIPFEGGTLTYILMEYIDGKTLAEYLGEKKKKKDNKKVDEQHLCKSLQELFKKLQSKNIVHGDITLNNIIVINQDNKIQLKLLDFATTRYVKKTNKKYSNLDRYSLMDHLDQYKSFPMMRNYKGMNAKRVNELFSLLTKKIKEPKEGFFQAWKNLFCDYCKEYNIDDNQVCTEVDEGKTSSRDEVDNGKEEDEDEGDPLGNGIRTIKSKLIKGKKKRTEA